MATIRPVRPSPRFPFKRYRVIYKVAGEQRQFGLYDTLDEAEQAKRDCETHLAKGRNPGAKHTPLGQFIKHDWLPGYDPGSAQRLRTVKTHLNAHILPSLGELSFQELSKLSVLTRWKKALVAAGYSPSTIHSLLALLSMIFDRAVADHYLEHNPMRKPGTLKRWPELQIRVGPSRPRYLTHPEAITLPEALAEPYRMLVLLLLYTGLRFGEATALEWRHLQRRAYFDGAVRGTALLRVEQTVEDPDRCRPQIKPDAKTAASIRQIAVQPYLLEQLDAYHEQYPGGPNLIFRAPGGGQGKKRGTGGIMVDSHVNRYLRAAIKTAKLTDPWTES